MVSTTLFFATLTVICISQIAAVDITGRFFTLSVIQGNTLGVCPSVDFRRLSGNPQATEKFSVQGVDFNSTEPNRAARINSIVLEVTGRRISGDLSSGVFLIKRRDFLFGVVSSGVFAISRTPIAPKRLRVAKILIKLLGERPLIAQHRNCVYAPIAVPRLSFSRFKGTYFRLFVSTIDVPVDGVKCAKVFYKKNSGNGFRFGVARVRNGKLETFKGTFIRENPLFQGQFVLDLDAFPPIKIWVLKLGPVFKGEYEYVISATPTLSTIFIDARNRRRFRALYEKRVFRFLFKKYKIRRSRFNDLSRSRRCFRKLPKKSIV